MQVQGEFQLQQPPRPLSSPLIPREEAGAAAYTNTVVLQDGTASLVLVLLPEKGALTPCLCRKMGQSSQVPKWGHRAR